MSSPKITKIMMISAITETLKKDGKRITNLNKASIEELNELIIKYNIDINTYAIKRTAELKMKRIKDKTDKQDKQDKANDLFSKCMKRNALIDQLCLQLDDLLIKKTVYVMEINHNYYWKINGVKLLEENDKIVKMVDAEYEELKKLLPSNHMFERVNETTINSKGINISYGSLNRKETSEQWIYEANQDLDNNKQLLFEYGILNVLCDNHKYYINSKATYNEVKYEKMIKDVEKYVNNKYPLLLEKYKMSFVKKLSGALV
jgi:hypothetical protein